MAQRGIHGTERSELVHAVPTGPVSRNCSRCNLAILWSTSIVCGRCWDVREGFVYELGDDIAITLEHRRWQFIKLMQVTRNR